MCYLKKIGSLYRFSVLAIILFIGLAFIQGAEIQADTVNPRQEVLAIVDQLATMFEENHRLTDDQLAAFQAMRAFDKIKDDQLNDIANLLGDKNADARAMALEILGSLNQPQFLERMSPLLEDDSRCLTAEPMFSNDVPDMTFYGWSRCTVGDIARQAIFNLTSQQFYNQEDFNIWWNTNKEFSAKYWYWQREFYLAWQKENELGVRKVLKRLMQEPPQRRAKVVLLMRNPEAKGALITEKGESFLSDNEIIEIVKTAMSSQELLNILDRENVLAEWSEIHDDENYCQLLESIGIYSDQLFTSEDFIRLEQIFKANQERLFWFCSAAFSIGISRLQPASSDGFLIKRIEEERDVFARGYLVKELMDKLLDQAWPYLKELFFSEKSDLHNPDVRQKIIRELKDTENGQEYLKTIVNDPRFHSLSFETYSELYQIYDRRIPQELWDQFQKKVIYNSLVRKKVLELYSQRKLHSPSSSEIDFSNMKEILPEISAELSDLTHRLQKAILSVDEDVN